MPLYDPQVPLWPWDDLGGDWAVRVHSSGPGISPSCFTGRGNVPAQQWRPVSTIRASQWEGRLHSVSVRPQEGAAVDTGCVAGRIEEPPVRIPFWASWSWDVLAHVGAPGSVRESGSPCRPPSWRTVGAGPHLSVALAARHNNWFFKVEAECNPAAISFLHYYQLWNDMILSPELSIMSVPQNSFSLLIKLFWCPCSWELRRNTES